MPKTIEITYWYVKQLILPKEIVTVSNYSDKCYYVIFICGVNIGPLILLDIKDSQQKLVLQV